MKVNLNLKETYDSSTPYNYATVRIRTRFILIHTELGFCIFLSRTKVGDRPHNYDHDVKARNISSLNNSEKMRSSRTSNIS